MRQIGQNPLLCRIIDLLGHMRPDLQLRREVAGLKLASPIGLSAVIDRRGRAFGAFERFGFGFIESGPVSLDNRSEPEKLSLALSARCIQGQRGCVALESMLAEFQRQPSRMSVARFIRIAPTPNDGSADALRKLAHYASALIVHKNLAQQATQSGKPWGMCVPLAECSHISDIAGASLIVIDPDEECWSPADRERGLDAVRILRNKFRDTPILYAAGGIECPADAVAFVNAGADLISLSHGFVFTGPGTPKRMNEALAAARAVGDKADQAMTLIESARYAWFWCFMLGAAMTLGSILAGGFALTRVVLPYDEAATGITRSQIERANPHLLHFMAHDRLSLAGTMMSLGLLYMMLAYFGVRRGRSWAQEAVVYSSFAGFLTFFAFLAYGYFDAFHAFVAGCMLPMAIQCAVGRTASSQKCVPDHKNDTAWRRACWGQLFWVLEAAGLLSAGMAITILGGTHVFVNSDLAYLGTTLDSLSVLHANLVPLVAHDRATFGGMLLSSGIAVLIVALWGFRRGERWLWWTVGLGGLPAYIATLWIHHSIQYTDALHLSPVFIGFLFHIMGWKLSAAYLKAEKPW